MAVLNCRIPASLLALLESEAAGNVDQSLSHIVTVALSQYFGKAIHTLFQVSTSGALVEGVVSGAVTSKTILEHGDFGLGTFEHLDGEMVILDGQVYQVRGDGSVRIAPPESSAPFAVVTRFAPETDIAIAATPSLAALEALCDCNRTSNNIFYAVRLDGVFKSIRTRAVCPPTEFGSRLIDAAKSQSEFDFHDIRGTLVGLWSPGFSTAFSIPGYHFHFISDDRLHGGHLLSCSADALRLRVETLSHFHLALPENESFLKADLSKDNSGELAIAEKAH